MRGVLVGAGLVLALAAALPGPFAVGLVYAGLVAVAIGALSVSGGISGPVDWEVLYVGRAVPGLREQRGRTARVSTHEGLRFGGWAVLLGAAAIALGYALGAPTA